MFSLAESTPESKVLRHVSHKEGLRRVEGRKGKVNGATCSTMMWTYAVPKGWTQYRLMHEIVGEFLCGCWLFWVSLSFHVYVCECVYIYTHIYDWNIHASLYIQTEWLAYWCCKYIQLEIKHKETDLQLKFLSSSIFFVYTYNCVTAGLCQQSVVISYWCQVCVLANDLWCKLHVTTNLVCLLIIAVLVYFWIYCELSWQTILFSGYSPLCLSVC